MSRNAQLLVKVFAPINEVEINKFLAGEEGEGVSVHDIRIAGGTLPPPEGAQSDPARALSGSVCIILYETMNARGGRPETGTR
ncbi:MAG: hypothetical protein WKG32_12980 [Gemmatimonadaceae bacterium]